jgi:heme A synthase
LALTLLQLVLRITKTGKKSARYSLALLSLLGFQIVLGLTQIWLGVPIILVGLHMLGASLLTSVITYQALLNRAWLGSK